MHQDQPQDIDGDQVTGTCIAQTDNVVKVVNHLMLE